MSSSAKLGDGPKETSDQSSNPFANPLELIATSIEKLQSRIMKRIIIFKCILVFRLQVTTSPDEHDEIIDEQRDEFAETLGKELFVFRKQVRSLMSSSESELNKKIIASFPTEIVDSLSGTIDQQLEEIVIRLRKEYVHFCKHIETSMKKLESEFEKKIETFFEQKMKSLESEFPILKVPNEF
ncbi:uncharacterized protein LOC128388348 [Panonychus citri]|uniref:uncharacterized protein LOC128388348 n=1 Tax=Panonychus citri TaxID=50023 RepID=UPI002307064E|nr:uncharacterized protein LOC128388348 [Panonychus citri]